MTVVLALAACISLLPTDARGEASQSIEQLRARADAQLSREQDRLGQLERRYRSALGKLGVDLCGGGIITRAVNTVLTLPLIHLPGVDASTERRWNSLRAHASTIWLHAQKKLELGLSGRPAAIREYAVLVGQLARLIGQQINLLSPYVAQIERRSLTSAPNPRRPATDGGFVDRALVTFGRALRRRPENACRSET